MMKNGVFSDRMISQLIESGCVFSKEPFEQQHVQPASLDLRLGNIAYQIKASFLPGGYSSILEKINGLDLQVDEIDLTRPSVLQKGCVYVVPLLEELDLPEDVCARANPRSTSGRLDIFVRLLTDYGQVFDDVPFGYKGKLYAEIVPKTFSVLLSRGTRLNQLRFMYGRPVVSDEEIINLHSKETLLCNFDSSQCDAQVSDGLLVSVNLQESDIVGYRARQDAPILDFSKVHHYDPYCFWEPVYCPSNKCIVLNPGDLYILISKEKVRVPLSYAAEMVPIEPSIGEFRVHYAGFFDPGFGYGSNNDITGTPAVLEVRAHDAPFMIEDRQLIAKLMYLPLIEPPKKVYGTSIGSSYQFQKLTLSKQFKSIIK